LGGSPRAQPDPISARFSLRSASPRSIPVLRTVRFQPPTRFHGNPNRRASALPIARRRLFQSMKREGSAAAVLPSFIRAASFAPSLPRPTRGSSRRLGQAPRFDFIERTAVARYPRSSA
jgi:hypothetical protein